VEVLKTILLSLVKLFFVRAPEVKQMLGEFLHFVIWE